MKIAVFRDSLTINHGSDDSESLVDWFKMLGHDVVHLTAIAQAGKGIPEILNKDLMHAEAFEQFAPDVLIIIIDLNRADFPTEQIQYTFNQGGMIIYLGPSKPWNGSGKNPSIWFLASRGFFFQCLSPGNPRPISQPDGSPIRFSRERLLRQSFIRETMLEGVNFIELTRPFILSDIPDLLPLLRISGDSYRLWGTENYLERGEYTIAAMKKEKGMEVLITGDMLAGHGGALLFSNISFISNMILDLMRHTGQETTPSTGQDLSKKLIISSLPKNMIEQNMASIYISTSPVNQPFADLLQNWLETQGCSVSRELEIGMLEEALTNKVSVFVALLDKGWSKSQQAEEIQKAMEISSKDPDKLRFIPIDVHAQLGKERDKPLTLPWVFVPAQDPKQWDHVFDLVLRAGTRQHGIFQWKPFAQGRKTFISYSFQDFEIASKTAKVLEQAELDVFLADETTLLNTKLRQQLERLVGECDIFVAVITKPYRASNWSFFEAEVALERAKRSKSPKIALVVQPGERIPRWYEGYPALSTEKLATLPEILGIKNSPQK